MKPAAADLPCVNTEFIGEIRNCNHTKRKIIDTKGSCVRPDSSGVMALADSTVALRNVRRRTEKILLSAIAFVMLAISTTSLAAQIVNGSNVRSSATEKVKLDDAESAGSSSAVTSRVELRSKLIVIGFVGGRVRADNGVHGEVQFSQALQESYGASLDSFIFSNRDGERALRGVLERLDRNHDGALSDAEKMRARIVLYGHSWGASQAITFARRLNQLGIPVLLTIQVDSVRKPGQNDSVIPPNVRSAVNFYQSDGLLRGRSRIVPADPEKTSILGNFRSSYRNRSVSCKGFPWYAKVFMRRHIEIENDPAVWKQIEAMILDQIGSAS